MNDLLVLLATIASLLANPKVQANPVLLSQAMQISQAVNALVENSTAMQAANSPTFGQIPADEVQPTQDTSIESPVLGAVESTTPMCGYVYPGLGVRMVACSLIQNCAATNSCPQTP
jgi:hypothetical protein